MSLWLIGQVRLLAMPMNEHAHTVLVLAGTGEARAIAARLAGRPSLRVISSLAGRTAAPAMPEGEIRIGGFGGAEGLADYIRANTVHAVIDATHPFATGISANAVAAGQLSGVPLIRFERAPWSPESGDVWDFTTDEAGAAETIEQGAVVFLALGSQHITAFGHRSDVTFITRTVDQPAALPGANWIAVVGKPSPEVEGEIALFKTHGISRVVCRNSGGKAGYAKIHAARLLGLPVTMISRPEPIGGVPLERIDEVVRELDRHLAQR